MGKSKNFNVFLMDGDVTGRIKCTLLNWTGLVYKVPRPHLGKCDNVEGLKRSGVYFLFGKNDQDVDEVYIGQAGNRKNGEGILLRVKEHLKDEMYFKDAVIVTTQNNLFGPTEISYLENKFMNMAKDIGRYKIINQNEPNIGNVTEEKESELEDFIEYSEMVLGVLGYKIFVPLTKQKEEQKTEQKEATNTQDNYLQLYLSRKIKRADNKQIEAICQRTNEGFVVLKGSSIVEEDAKTIPNTIKELRKKCRKNKDIVDGKLTKNFLFNSPSYAAAFVLGTNTNGRTDWKTEEGETLKELEEKEIMLLSFM